MNPAPSATQTPSQMVAHYDQLTGAERLAIATAARAIIAALNRDFSLSDICERINRAGSNYQIEFNAFKLFLYRKNEKRINSSKMGVLPAICDFIKLHYDSFPPAAKQVTLKNLHVLEPIAINLNLSENIDFNIEQQITALLANWTRVDNRAIQSIGERFSGIFALFRKSSSFANTVIRSNLHISFDAIRNVIHCVHDFKDMAEGSRTSTGVLIPVFRNIYGILSIEGGEALELLALAQPIARKGPVLIHGASITIGLQCSPISTKIVLDSNNELWDGSPTRIELDKTDFCKIDQSLKDRKDRIEKIIPFLDQATSNMIQT